MGILGGIRIRAKNVWILKEAEEEAKVKKPGLWASDDPPVAPWDCLGNYIQSFAG
jgi:hypothetical protein